MADGITVRVRHKVGEWWDVMWAHCDEHAGDRADGHYDRMPWRDVSVALARYDAATK